MNYTYAQAIKLIESDKSIPREWISVIKNKTIPMDIREQKYNEAYQALIEIMDEIAPIKCSAGAYQPSLFIKGFFEEEIKSWTTFINKVLLFSGINSRYNIFETLDIINGALIFGLPLPTTAKNIKSKDELTNTYNSDEDKLYQTIINYIQNFAVNNFKTTNAIFSTNKLTDQQELDACELALYIHCPAISHAHNFTNQVENLEAFNKVMDAHKSFINDIFSRLTHIPTRTIESLRAVFPST